MILVIKSADQKVSKTAQKPYLDVIDMAGNRYSCWDTSLWNLLQPKLAVEVETQKKGNYTNIIGAKSVAEQVERAIETAEKAGVKVKSATVEEKMTKDDWKEKDKITRTSIQRQTALKEANLQTLKQIELNPKIAELKSPEIAQVTINVARIFEKYLDGD